MMNILTFGVYDMLHIGHIVLFKKLGDYVKANGGGKVIVAVQDDDYVLKYKPKAKLIYNTEERLFMVQSIRYVDTVVTYKNIDEDIKKIDFDIFAKGPDQCHEGFQRAVRWCENNGKHVLTIPRTEGISSTLLKQYMKL